MAYVAALLQRFRLAAVQVGILRWKLTGAVPLAWDKLRVSVEMSECLLLGHHRLRSAVNSPTTYDHKMFHSD
jgi:hypothetical protein